jgi:perosamine synthetase
MLKNKLNIPFGKPIVDEKEISAIKQVLKSGVYVHGRKSIEFEKKFKSLTKAKYATSVSSCTAGMHLLYFTLGIGHGDEVIVPAQTHVATAHAVQLVGAKPVFVDCDQDTGNINLDKIEEKINKKTKAIAVVHFLGVPVKMKKIIYLAKKYDLKIIEDCALSLGATYKNKHTGLLGTAGVFSFYPIKHITTAEGGMIITSDKLLYKKLATNKALGINKNYNERKTAGFYDAINLGFNYRMSEIHAAIGVEQLKKFRFFLKKRKKNFDLLYKILSEIKNIKVLKSVNKECKNSFYALNFILQNKLKKNRELITDQLKKNKIGFSIYYPQPVPRMTYYKKKYGYKANQFQNASKISDFSISLPVGPHISKKEILKIGNVLNNILDKLN